MGIGITNPQAKLAVAGGDAIINNVAIGTDPPSVVGGYLNEHETVGAALPGATLRLQSPNGLAFHAGPTCTWTSSSDIRLKKSVRSLKGALEKLLRLRGVSFEWKQPEKQGNLRGVQMGLVAQEVEEVLPEWISTDPRGYKNLTVRGFEALVVEAFKELKAENETWMTKNEELEDRIRILESNISEPQAFPHHGFCKQVLVGIDDLSGTTLWRGSKL